MFMDPSRQYSDPSMTTAADGSDDGGKDVLVVVVADVSCCYTDDQPCTRNRGTQVLIT